MREAIFIAEFGSIPMGIQKLDDMVKRAPALIIQARPICIGKYLVILGGAVENMREMQSVALEPDAGRLLSQYLLTNAHPGILAYFKRADRPESRVADGATAVGIVETRTIAEGFRALDAGLKSGNVDLGRIWSGHFIGGKFCFLVTGDLSGVQTSIRAAGRELGDKSLLDCRVIPGPDAGTLRHILGKGPSDIDK